jgi:hypothetical protein
LWYLVAWQTFSNRAMDDDPHGPDWEFDAPEGADPDAVLGVDPFHLQGATELTEEVLSPEERTLAILELLSGQTTLRFDGISRSRRDRILSRDRGLADPP